MGLRNNYENYRPEFLGVILATLLLIIWFLASLAIEHKIIPTNYKLVLDFITPALAAFLGAYAAFQLNSKREKEQKNNEQRQALYKAQFIIISMIKHCELIKRKLNKYKSDESMAFEMRPSIYPDRSRLKLNMDSLTFLLDTKWAELCFELELKQQKFEQAMICIELRDKDFNEVIFPELKKLTYPTPYPIPASWDWFKSNLTPRAFELGTTGAINIKGNWEPIISLLTHSLEKLDKLFEELYPGSPKLKAE